MFAEAPRRLVEAVYVTPDFETQHADLLAGVDYELTDERVFASMSDTQTPQGILSLIRMPSYTEGEVLEGEHPFLMVLCDIQDPGNLGTILRTAEGAGVTGLVLSAHTADLFNPKTIRSTMGSVYRMPFIYADIPDMLARLANRQVTTYAADLSGSAMYDEADYTAGTAFLIGNEGNGLDPELVWAADVRIRIPMSGRVESLNAAVASAVLMYEVSRQRRGKLPGCV